MTFARLYAENELQEGHQVLLIPCGQIGTSFQQNDWNSGNPLFEDAANRLNSMKQLYALSNVKAVLWHQGENDVDNPNYMNDLDGFITQFRAKTGTKDVPFLLGGIVPYWVAQSPERQQTQSIIKDTPNRVNLTGYADPNFPTTITKPVDSIDAIHFNANGMIQLGERYFTEYLQLK